MERNKKIMFFLKFGKKEHLNNFRNKGQLNFRNLENFREMPEDNGIGDKLEGTKFYTPISAGSILHFGTGETKVALKIINPTYIHSKEKFKGKILCLYYGDEDYLQSKADSKESFLDFENSFKENNHCLFIHNPVEFINKLEAYLDFVQIEYKHCCVDYYDAQNNIKELTPFTKRDIYKDQREFRIWINHTSLQDFRPEIGDLSDISSVAKLNDDRKIYIEARERTNPY